MRRGSLVVVVDVVVVVSSATLVVVVGLAVVTRIVVVVPRMVVVVVVGGAVVVVGTGVVTLFTAASHVSNFCRHLMSLSCSSFKASCNFSLSLSRRFFASSYEGGGPPTPSTRPRTSGL